MTTEVRTALKDWLAFLRHPTREHYVGFTGRQKFTRFFAIFVLDLGLTLLSFGGIAIVTALEIVDLEQHAVAEALKDMPPAVIFVMAVFLAPFVEELFFRGPISFFTRPMQIAEVPVTTTNLAIETPTDVPPSQIPEPTKSGFVFLFWFLCLAFAYMHIFNYTDRTTALWLVSPLLVLPQFVIGTLCAYLGVRFNWGFAVLLHLCHNMLFVGITLLGSGLE